MKVMRYTEHMIEECFRKGLWDSMTMSRYWERNADMYPHREAIADSRIRLTWSEARQRIDRLAVGLIESGIQRHELLVIQLPNCVDGYLLRLACEKAGILHLPALTAFRAAEMEHILKESGAVGVIIPWKIKDRDYFQPVQEIRPMLPKLRNVYVFGDRVPEDTLSLEEMIQKSSEDTYPPDYLEYRRFKSWEISWIAHTTGSTGLPKLVKYFAANRPCQGRGIAERLRLTKDDIVGVISPAPVGPNFPPYFGAPVAASKVVMLETFDAEGALELIEREKVTVFGATQPLLMRMLAHPHFDQYDLSSLRLVMNSAAPLQYKVGTEVEEKMECTVINSFGAMDCGATLISMLHEPKEARIKSAGKPISQARVKIVDDQGKEVLRGETGEVWMTGPACCDGYLDDPDSTEEVWTEDGWFKTGDYGKMDDLENVILVGRKKDIINRGGQNIAPAEINEVLIAHPKLVAVAVVGMPDPVMGEKVCAYVVPKRGEEFTFDEMISFLKARKVASYKLPERLEMMDQFPLVGGEKVDVRALVQDITQKLENEGKM